MLRTRFELDSHGSWVQETIFSGNTSIKFRHQRVKSLDAAQDIITVTDAGLDISNGPIFAASLISISEGSFEHDLLHLVAHHLSVDLVSWRIILEDLEMLIRTKGAAILPSSDSFDRWTTLQAEYYGSANLSKVDHCTTSADLSFLGMHEPPNLLRDVLEASFELDYETMQRISGGCNSAYRTTTLDLLLAATLHSFIRVFPDRGVPNLFNETHGRD